MSTDLDELSETRRVVVTNSAGVSEGLEDDVGLQDLVLNPLGSRRRHRAQILKDKLGRFRLSR